MGSTRRISILIALKKEKARRRPWGQVTWPESQEQGFSQTWGGCLEEAFSFLSLGTSYCSQRLPCSQAHAEWSLAGRLLWDGLCVSKHMQYRVGVQGPHLRFWPLTGFWAWTERSGIQVLRLWGLIGSDLQWFWNVWTFWFALQLTSKNKNYLINIKYLSDVLC